MKAMSVGVTDAWVFGVWGALCLGVCGMVSHTVFSNYLIIKMIARVVCQTPALKGGFGTVCFVRY